MPEALLELDSLRAELDQWNVTCGARVRVRRKALRLTQAKLAALSGTEIQTIWKIEHGRIYPRDHLKHAVAYALASEVLDLWPPLSRQRVGEISAVGAAA